MKDVRVEYSVEATVNTGNFENLRPGFTVSATVEDGENVDSVRSKLVKKADEWLETEVLRIKSGEK